MRAGPLVEIKDIAMKYHTLQGEIPALKNINLAIAEGEFISIVGPSGCGKSTLLNLIAGLIEPASGEIRIEGQAVHGPSAAVGYMLQSDQLFPWRTIWKNVLLGLEIQNKLSPASQVYARELLHKYGMADFIHARPGQLSGGMRQRVALIRTLAINPSILLLDEAFSALDYQTRLIVSDEVKQIIIKENKTAILVTHDIAEAISMSDRIVVLTKRPGEIKNIYPIKLTVEANTPLMRRKSPEFKDYFNLIWKELDIYVA